MWEREEQVKWHDKEADKSTKWGIYRTADPVFATSQGKGQGPALYKKWLKHHNKQISSVDFFMYSKLYVAYCCLDIKIM